MIEQVMIFALGFLVAGVIALAIAPAFWQRAIRLSTRRLAMQLPLSLEEVLAARDLLRAEFAVEQRRLEQKVEALNRVHAEDMTQLGRQAVLLDAKTADLLATSQQGSDRGAEVAALKRALTETSAELAVTSKEFYDVSGLVSRKDTRIDELAAALREAEARAAKQKDVLAAIESQRALEEQKIAAQEETIARLEGEVATLQLQHQADLVTLKTAAARVADREEALEAAGKREKELIRHRQLQTETANATEAGYHEKIERLRSAHAATQEELGEARRTCEGLTRLLDGLRATMPHQDAETILRQHEENEILREKINEIGAAIIRAADDALEAAPDESLAAGGHEAGRRSQKATA